ncbi:MAG: hypothetical protein ACO1SX_02785 [Actinomycetota bacterium]
MFNQLRDPNGKFTLLASGIALFLLAGFTLPLLRTRAAVIPLGLAAAAVACLVAWRRRGERDKYDLRTLFDTPAPDELETPYVDAIPDGEVGAPYCGYCDECYAPGTHRCPHCRRALG